MEMWVRASVIVALLTLLWQSAYLQQPEEEKQFPCHSLSRDNYTCGECVRFHTSCAWCKKSGYDEKSQLSRCDSIGRLIDNGCGNEGDYVNPKTQAEVRGQLVEQPNEQPVELKRQLFPESVRVRLRPMDSYKFNIIYRQVKNYPVDLYYLMDLSNSMEDDRDKITELGDLLAERMNQITKNFQLGFGSFVDKKLIPFVDPREDRRDRPCTTCAPPYGFNHEMTLTDNTTLFKNKVKAAQISGNLDGPEGGFDAIMQALVCPEVIGWREKSRKMIVFSTDAGFHYAGDGRLAGVVTPNDGECHMSASLGSKYTYTMSDHQDYPSISQLHEKIRAAQANVIFAVTERQVPLYNRLKDALPDVSASVGMLAEDSNNVVELITQEYEKISEKLIMVDNLNASQGLRLSYRTKCKGKEMQDTNVCDEVKLGDNIMWEVTLDHVACVDQKQFKIEIGPSGLSEFVALDVYVDCDCPCENDNSVIKSSPLCSRSGDLKCGVCDCRGGAVGRSCECAGLDVTTSQLDARCKQFNESEICSGRGVCECGECKCNKRPGKEEITGKYCQCDNFQCPRHNGLVCNGQGSCECKECQCKPGWTGYACDCPVSDDACKDESGKICSGHGECVCGQCKCHERYSGPLCDTCTTCPTKCIEYRPCVMCKAWGTGPYNETQCDDPDVCPWEPIIVDELPELAENDTKISCQFTDQSDDCRFYFMYDYNEEFDNVTVWIQREKECPPPLPILAIVLGLIAGIVLIGLILLLVWKLLTVLHDRREYAMFEQERLMAKWDTGENPIFQPATSTFKNPLFAGGRN